VALPVVAETFRSRKKARVTLPRRTALKLMSVGAVTVFSGNVRAAQSGLITRRSLTNMPIDDPIISTYRDFVGMMQPPAPTLPQNINWLQFSLQHGNYDTEQYKFCPHGDWYFLPWHRAFTLMYEKAAQTLTHNPDFAMPYWNWTEMRDYPEAFANPQYKGKPNPLYIENRNALVGQHALTDSIVGQPLMDRIFRETVFEAFGTTRNPDQTDTDPSWVVRGGGYQGPLENKPHNQVHNRIGVFMPTPGSPRDPLFFMHHSNIDRIWAHWNALGRKNSSDPLWLNMTFPDNFIKPDGTLYSATVKDLQNISDLGYTYDFLPAPDGRTPDAARDTRLLAILHSRPGAAVAGAERTGGVNRLPATAARALHREWTMSDASIKSLATPTATGSGTEVFALIRDIVIGERVTGIRVFVNRPDVTASVPDTDPHYVTTVAFLSHEGGHTGADIHGRPAQKQLPSAIVNLTDTLRHLYGFRRLHAGKLTIQIIPVPAPGVALQSIGAVVPASVEIVVL
jgi:tyrosinase